MPEIRKGDGFFDQVNKFFKRVQNKDLLKISTNSINILNSPQSKEEAKTKRELQVFKQYLQSKNWNLKHIELFDEYRRMDATFPLISAALKLYSQEICLSGDCIVTIPSGEIKIKELYKQKRDLFLVQSYDYKNNRLTWCECKGIISNGIKDVYEVTVQRNITKEMQGWDKIETAKFKCTDNHKIYIGENKYKELRELNIGDSIFAYYRDIDPSCKCKVDHFVSTIILNIEKVGQEEVYDLINVSPFSHFSLKLTDSFYVIVHNCSKDTDGNVIKIISDDLSIKNSLDKCYFDNLKLNTRGYLIAKTLLKFGNTFGYLNTRKGVGVTDLIYLPPESMRIHLLENSERLDEFKYHWWGYGSGLQFDPWEIVHWKIIEDMESEPYGQSILRAIVDTWRRIVLMREALIIYRITRAPQRYMFKIDTSGMAPDEALLFADEMRKSLMKKPLVNPTTGEIDYKYNVASIEENFFVPTTQDSVSDISVIEGANNMDQVEDYKIISQDMYTGLMIPNAFLNFESDLCLRGNTEVLTSDGSYSIKKIADLFDKNNNIKLYSLSCNSYGFITLGKINNCWATKQVDLLYKITLSNNKYVECTENHPFLLLDMTYKRADELKIGDELKNKFDSLITIINIEQIKLEELEWVYDLEVEEHHNFALDSGIFVHNSNKAALSQEDLRFSNAVKQYQSYFIEGLLHIGLVHLYLNGFGKDELEAFEIQMSSNSTLAEKNRNELLQQRFDLAKSALDTSNGGIALMSYVDVLKNILKFSDEEISKTFKNQMIEKKLIWRLNQLTESGYYEDPDPDKKKAKMMGIKDTSDDVFKDLQFESIGNSEKLESIKTILTEKINKEIDFLIKPTKLKPSTKQIELTIDLNKDKVNRNIKKTYTDLGLKPTEL